MYSPFDHLPENILVDIFSFVPTFSLLRHMPAVSRRFDRVSRDNRCQRDIRPQVNGEAEEVRLQLWNFLERNHQIKSLTLGLSKPFLDGEEAQVHNFKCFKMLL
jgi:hypothetical protein